MIDVTTDLGADDSIQVDLAVHALDVLSLVATVMDTSTDGIIDLRAVNATTHHWCQTHMEAFALLLSGAYSKFGLSAQDVREEAPRISRMLLRAVIE